MAQASSFGILSKAEITTLNENGFDLDESGNKTYILKFLFNDQKNEATDPMPFRIATEALDKIADTFVGRPYVYNPGIKGNVGEHVRGPVDDPKKIVEFQKKYAIGEILGKMRNPKTNNVYAIIEPFPEFKEEILNGDIPLPTSPLLEPLDMRGDTIFDARGLHLQAVQNSGYPMQLTSKLGVCVGMLNQCTAELRTLGSSGQLKKFQNNFSYTNSSIGGGMGDGDSNPAGDSSAGSKMSVEDIVANHDKMLQDHGKMLEDHGKSLGAIKDSLDQVLKNTSDKPGDNYPGTDGSKGQSTGAGYKGSMGSNSGTRGAAGEQQTVMIEVPKKEYEELQSIVKTVSTDFEALKKENEEKEKALAIKQRTEDARIIAEGEILTKEVPADKFEERVKFYVGLKKAKDSEELVDLSLLAEKFKKMFKSKTLGSSREFTEDERFPLLDTLGASGNKSEVSVLDVMEDVS